LRGVRFWLQMWWDLRNLFHCRNDFEGADKTARETFFILGDDLGPVSGCSHLSLPNFSCFLFISGIAFWPS
jgi:hypothetical protein